MNIYDILKVFGTGTTSQSIGLVINNSNGQSVYVIKDDGSFSSGISNVSTGSTSICIGGTGSTASGAFSAIIGGRNNNLTGNRSIVLCGNQVSESADDTVFSPNLTVFNSLSTRSTTETFSESPVNDYNLPNTSFLRADTTGTITLTGIANGFDGRRLVISNIGTGSLVLSNDDVNSQSGNRIITNSNSTDITLGNGSSLELIYDSSSSCWRVIRGF